MRFAVSSSSGQVLVTGQLILLKDADDDFTLAFRTDRGNVIQGGKIADDGDLTQASRELFRSFFQTWGMSGVVLTSKQ
jgi:hypothetical protein